jgi:hypothetical protein
MLKQLTTVAGMVLLASSFALAGQSSSSPTAPRTDPRVTTQRQHTQTLTHRRGGKKHHKKHKDQKSQATKSHRR